MAVARPNDRPIIIVRRVRKRVHAHQGGAWKVAYADFVTAMMAFFMLLWLISNPDAVQLKGLAEYFSAAPPSSSSSTSMTIAPGDMPGLGGRARRAQADSPTALGQPTAEAGVAGSSRGGTANVPDASMRVLAQELRIALDSLPADTGGKQVHQVETSREGLRISLMDSATRSMFRRGTAELNPYAQQMLAEVASRLRKSGAPIAVEGHTDAVGGDDDANWRLSGERALAARAALIAGGLMPDRFRELVAKGSTQPVYPDQPMRPENRRITIVVLGEASALPIHASFKF